MKVIFTGLIIFSLSTVWAQQTKSICQTVGVTGGASVLEYSVKGYFEPYLAWGTSKKQIIMAPTVLVGSNLGYQSPQSPRLTGAKLGYRFWPGSLDNKWNFYLSIDMRLQRLKDIWDGNFYSETLSGYQTIHIKSLEYSLENYFGYGLVYKISKAVQISQGVGLGWYLSDLDTKATNANAQIADIADYRGYDNAGFLWNLSLGVSYSLHK